MARYYRLGWLDPTEHPGIGAAIANPTGQPDRHRAAAIFGAYNGHARYPRILVYNSLDLPIPDELDIGPRQFHNMAPTVFAYHPGWGTSLRRTQTTVYFDISGIYTPVDSPKPYPMLRPTGLTP